MPRTARKDSETSFFHVMIQGINREYIFYKNEYIEKYLELIKRYKEEYKISVLAYCIMNNHAHLLVHTQKIEEMTKFMHKINGIFAQYYNKNEDRVGVVLRNRYESEPIYNEKYLARCIRYIHMNPVKAKIAKYCEEYKYSTAKEFANNTGAAKNPILIDVFGKGYLEWLNESYDDGIFKDIDINKSEVLEEGIKKFENIKEAKLENILQNKEETRELIKFLKSNYKITYVDMMKRLDITKGKMEMLKK